MQKSLQKADNYGFILTDNQEKTVLYLDKICYEIEANGTLSPIACGDEIATLCGGKIAVRQGQNVKII